MTTPAQLRDGVPPRLSIEDFGAELLRTLDLDPVYVALTKASLSPEQLAKWLLTYWCFYHAGVASQLSEERSNLKYWALMYQAAVNDRSIKTWPRSAERRHFRGAQALRGVDGLQKLFLNPTDMLDALKQHTTFTSLNRYVQTWPQFGPWIAFKVCDMAQCVLGQELDFTGASLATYDEPAKGARLAYYAWNPELGNPTEDKSTEYGKSFYVNYAVTKLTLRFGGQMAPPHFNRAVNFMEYETILCKWKSHLSGHYPPGKDTNELIDGLNGWGKTADQLRNTLCEVRKTWNSNF